MTTKASTGEGPRGKLVSSIFNHKDSSIIIEVPMGRGVVGRVADTAKSIRTSNARSLPYFDDTHDLKTGYRTKSILCVPVKVPGHKNDSVVAVLMLINKLQADTASASGRNRDDTKRSDTHGEGATFDEHDLALAERLAAQVSGPVAHAQEMIAIANKHTGNKGGEMIKLKSKMNELEKKATEALRKTEGDLRNKVVDERTKAGKMLNILSFGAGASKKEKNVGHILSEVLSEVRDVMQAQVVTFHMQDFERKILWPRSSSGNNVGFFSGNGATSLTTGGGGNKSTPSVAKAVASSLSAVGMETCRRACAMSGEPSGQTLGKTGVDVLCMPVMGLVGVAYGTSGETENSAGAEVVVGVLEAIYPTDEDMVGAEKIESVFLQAVCTHIGAVLIEETQSKCRAEGERKVSNDLKLLREQIQRIKKEEATREGELESKLQRERRLSSAAQVLASNTKFRKGKHGVMADLFGRTLAAVTGLVSADRGSLFLVDEKEGILRTTDMHSNDSASGDVKFIEIPIKPNSIAGSCAIMGQLTNVPDAYQDARFNRAIDKESGYRTKSMLTVPVHAADLFLGDEERSGGRDDDDDNDDTPGKVIAVLQLINKKSINSTSDTNSAGGKKKKKQKKSKPIPFDDNDVELVQRFVIQIAPSIRDALQQESQAHEVAASHKHLREVENRLAVERVAAKQREKELELATKKKDDETKELAQKEQKTASLYSSLGLKVVVLKDENTRMSAENAVLQEKVRELERVNTLQETTMKRLESRVHSDRETMNAQIAERDELEEQLLHSREREQELQASNRRQLEQITFMNQLPIVSPSIGRKNITRVGKAGMRVLREGGGDDKEEEFEVDEVEQDKEEGEGRLSARRRKKKKKMKKKSSNSPGNEKGGDRGVVLRFGPNSIQQQKKTLAKQGSSTARRRATKAKKKKKKPVMARLSAEGGGPVTVVIDRSLFMTGGAKGGARRSPKRRSNRYFGSPLRGSLSTSSARSTRSPSPASGRLLWGFA